jgi:hypothetical protein
VAGGSGPMHRSCNWSKDAGVKHDICWEGSSG